MARCFAVCHNTRPCRQYATFDLIEEIDGSYTKVYKPTCKAHVLFFDHDKWLSRVLSGYRVPLKHIEEALKYGLVQIRHDDLEKLSPSSPRHLRIYESILLHTRGFVPEYNIFLTNALLTRLMQIYCTYPQWPFDNTRYESRCHVQHRLAPVLYHDPKRWLTVVLWEYMRYRTDLVYTNRSMPPEYWAHFWTSLLTVYTLIPHELRYSYRQMLVQPFGFDWFSGFYDGFTGLTDEYYSAKETVLNHYRVYQEAVTQTIKNRIQPFKEELMAVTWHPDRMLAWCSDEEMRAEISSHFGSGASASL